MGSPSGDSANSEQIPLRVLHVGKYYPPFYGGIENFMADTLAFSASEQAGEFPIEVAALVHNHRPSFTLEEEKVESVPVFRSPAYGQFIFVPLSPLFPFHLARVVRNWQPDVLHLHVPNVSAFWVLLLRSCRALPCVVHWHSDVVASRIQRMLAFAYRFYRPLETALLQHADRIVVTSQIYLDSSAPLQQWREKCKVIPLGISNEGPNSDLSKRNFNENTFRLLCIGRLSYYKGHKYLVDAMKDAADCHLIMVGEGEKRKELEQQIDSLGLKNKVSLLGSVSYSQLQSLLLECDCLCLPSIERTEAFGVVLLEAMRAAKPIISSRVPGSGMTWLVEHGVNGLSVLPEDGAALANAIRELSEHPQRRIAMGQAGRKKFTQHFTVKRVTDQFRELYRNMLTKLD